MQGSLLMIPISPVIIMYANNYNDSNAFVVTVLMVTLNAVTICKAQSLFELYK
jgi:hypothetical protein